MRSGSLAAWLVGGCFTAGLAMAADPGAFGPFDRSLNDRPYGYQVVPDPTGAAPSPTVERFEVRPGDCGRQPGRDDCAEDRERSELSEKGGRGPVGSEFWYRWWLYVPTDYRTIYPTKVALGQFHQQDAHPVFMFQNDKGGYWLDDHRSGRTAEMIPLIAEDALRGKWHRIAIHARWSKREDGFFRLWVNGERKVAIDGPMTRHDGPIYVKYGLYRSFVSRWRKATGSEPPAQVVYYAGVARALSEAGLDAAP